MDTNPQPQRPSSLSGLQHTMLVFGSNHAIMLRVLQLQEQSRLSRHKYKCTTQAEIGASAVSALLNILGMHHANAR